MYRHKPGRTRRAVIISPSEAESKQVIFTSCFCSLTTGTPHVLAVVERSTSIVLTISTVLNHLHLIRVFSFTGSNANVCTDLLTSSFPLLDKT